MLACCAAIIPERETGREPRVAARRERNENWNK